MELKTEPESSTPTYRQWLKHLRVNAAGKWAVFLVGKKTSKFSCLHDTKEQAINEAQRLFTDAISRGMKEPKYFVVYIHCPVGIFEGILYGGNND